MQNWIRETSSSPLIGRTIMIVTSDIEDAVRLQDRITKMGAQVHTAYTVSRALLISASVPLDDALVEFDFAGAPEILSALREHQIPFVYYTPGDARRLAPPSTSLA